jgi:hypothetical protein
MLRIPRCLKRLAYAHPDHGKGMHKRADAPCANVARRLERHLESRRRTEEQRPRKECKSGNPCRALVFGGKTPPFRICGAFQDCGRLNRINRFFGKDGLGGILGINARSSDRAQLYGAEIARRSARVCDPGGFCLDGKKGGQEAKCQAVDNPSNRLQFEQPRLYGLDAELLPKFCVPSVISLECATWHHDMRV